MKTQKGFTLIELIVVVAILCIMLALAVPTFDKFSGQLSKPNSVTCENGYRTIQTESGSMQMLNEHGKGIKCDSKTME